MLYLLLNFCLCEPKTAPKNNIYLKGQKKKKKSQYLKVILRLFETKK